MYEDAGNSPGTVYMFGKVRANGENEPCQSICLVVRNIERVMYVLPRTQKRDGSTVENMDVFKEIRGLVKKTVPKVRSLESSP